MFQKTRGRKSRTKWTPLALTNSEDCPPLPTEQDSSAGSSSTAAVPQEACAVSGETDPDWPNLPEVQASALTPSPQQKHPAFPAEQGPSAGPPSTAAVPQEAWAVPGETECDWPSLPAAPPSTSSPTTHAQSSTTQDSPLTNPSPSQQTRSYAVEQAAATPAEISDGQAWMDWYYFGIPLQFEGRTDAEILVQVQQTEITSQQVSNEENCLICMGDNYTLGEKVYELPCKHCYHGECLVSWLRQHNTCPLCRAKALKMGGRLFIPGQPCDPSRRRAVPIRDRPYWQDLLQSRCSWAYK